jgi:plasmid stability protein
MAQLFVPELDDVVEERLKARARRHGRSLEAEARAILEEAAREEPLPPGLSEEGAPMQRADESDEKGFGDLMYERFKDIGLKPDEVRRFNRGIAEVNSRWEMGLPDFEADEYEATSAKK